MFGFELPGASLKARVSKGEPEEGASAHAVRVLVVDDNKDAADSLAEILWLLNFRVRTAYGGAAALEAARQEWHRAVFLDIAMPEMDGPAVLRQLRQLPGGQAIFCHGRHGLRRGRREGRARELRPL